MPIEAPQIDLRYSPFVSLQITLDQSGNPTGVPGQAREDFATGTPVQLSLSGGPYLEVFWSIVDKPIDYASSVQSSAGIVSPSASTTTIQPIDVAGTYLVACAVDSGSGLGATSDDVGTITFYAGATLGTLATDLPRRVPAFRERLEHNVPDAIFPTGNPRGWSEEMGRWLVTIEKLRAGTSETWGRIHLTLAGATLISGLNVATVARASAGIVDVTFTIHPANANYAVIASAKGAMGGSCCSYNETTSGFTIARADPWGALFDDDINFAVMTS